ncbi:MAG TPA: NADH-quinone oxidoreductase subunit C [Acidobacteriaceae bacterium]|nr:NADH-quinone oxidoreductase subunit C [Acidobacteriaceae bacterium]
MTSATENEKGQQRDAVLQAHEENPAIAALQANFSKAVLDAQFNLSELTLTIAREEIVNVCRTLQPAGFSFMSDLTCVDWYPNQPRFQVTYHLLSMSLKQRVRLCVLVPEGDPSVDSITSVWPAANFYEREIFDLFGVRFGGHPNLRRLLLPEEFQGNPLRKDFPVEGYR